MENITTMITSFTALVVAVSTLIVTILKAKKEIKNSLPNKIKTQCNINLDIIDKMERVKEVTGAARVHFYDFHNGGHYANGRSALKVSCSFEVVRIGVKAYQKELQAVPLSCIPKFVRTLLDNNTMKVNNIEDLKEKMPATYQLKYDQGVKSFFDIIINNKQGQPVGFLGIQFNEINRVNFLNCQKEEIYKLKYFIEENLEKMITKQ